MKYLSEFVIFFEDTQLPDESNICESLWKAQDFDSDGDFYYENINRRWTQLTLESIEEQELNSKLDVDIYWEFNRNYDPHFEGEMLKRYVLYRQQGYYRATKGIMEIEKPVIASLKFETFQQDHYLDFLKSIHYFLEYTKGYLVNYLCYDAKQFSEDFLREL